MNAIRYREYPCPECGKGIVRPIRIQNYKTRIKGYPFVVDQAVVGICDHCDAKTFHAQEIKRWQQRFEEAQEKRLMTPEERVELREKLGLSMEDFARLMGATRQSIHNWETGRLRPSRMADLMMRLVWASYASGKVDVLSILLSEAEKMGAAVQLQRFLEMP